MYGNFLSGLVGGIQNNQRNDLMKQSQAWQATLASDSHAEHLQQAAARGQASKAHEAYGRVVDDLLGKLGDASSQAQQQYRNQPMQQALALRRAQVEEAQSAYAASLATNSVADQSEARQALTAATNKLLTLSVDAQAQQVKDHEVMAGELYVMGSDKTPPTSAAYSALRSRALAVDPGFKDVLPESYNAANWPNLSRLLVGLGATSKTATAMRKEQEVMAYHQAMLQLGVARLDASKQHNRDMLFLRESEDSRREAKGAGSGKDVGAVYTKVWNPTAIKNAGISIAGALAGTGLVDKTTAPNHPTKYTLTPQGQQAADSIITAAQMASQAQIQSGVTSVDKVTPPGKVVQVMTQRFKILAKGLANDVVVPPDMLSDKGYADAVGTVRSGVQTLRNAMEAGRDTQATLDRWAAANGVDPLVVEMIRSKFMASGE